MGKRLDRIGDILVNRRLHFADPIRFNDPFDCSLGLDLSSGATNQDWLDYFTHLAEKEMPESSSGCCRAKAEDNIRRGRHTDPTFLDDTMEGILRDVKKIGRKQGVLCLSTDPKNLPMWAHYADNHEGLVLEFDTQHMGVQENGELRCFEVDYALSFPRLPDYLAALRATENGDMRSFARLFFCRKSRDWKHENEWRFFAGKPDSFIEFEPPMLSSIIFGWKMPESTRKLVTAWANTLITQPNMWQAVPCSDCFQMDIKALSYHHTPG